MAAGVATGLHGRSRRDPRRLLRIPLRAIRCADRPGRRRRAAGVPERVPAPRQLVVQRLGFGPAGAQMRLSRLDLGPGRRAQTGARPQGLRLAAAVRLSADPGPGRHLGGPGLRQPGPRRDAAARIPRKRYPRTSPGVGSTNSVATPPSPSRSTPTGRPSPTATARPTTSRRCIPSCCAAWTISMRRNRFGGIPESPISPTACRAHVSRARSATKRSGTLTFPPRAR